MESVCCKYLRVCVCVCVCVCIYMYIYIHTQIYISRGILVLFLFSTQLLSQYTSAIYYQCDTLVKAP